MNRSFSISLLTAAALALGFAGRAEAMPPFAQAYGVQCSTCHTQVPALNSYGRYIQRTGYAGLDPHVLHRATPIWVDESTWYDTQDADKPHYTELGNLSVHAVGALNNDWTYHVQTWLVSGNQWQNGTSADTAWFSYNNLLKRNGHLFMGLIEAPGPSAWSMWSDLSGFTTPELTVGEHAYQTDGNRWGAKFAYVHGSVDAEVAWMGSNLGWSGLSDWRNDTDKTVQWKLAHADPSQPLEYGLYGSVGSFPLAEGPVDRYTTYGAYAQRDPINYTPGFLVMYQMNHDSNPDDSFNAVGSNAATFEIQEAIFNHNPDSPSGQGLIGIRKEFTNDGFGDIGQSGNIDIGYHIARFLNIYGEVGMGQNSTPAWRYMLWWALPTSSVK